MFIDIDGLAGFKQGRMGKLFYHGHDIFTAGGHEAQGVDVGDGHTAGACRIANMFDVDDRAVQPNARGVAGLIEP